MGILLVVLNRFAWVVLILSTLAAGALSGGYFFVRDELPRLPQNLSEINYRPPTEIYSHDGEILKVLGARRTVTLDRISPHFQKAVVAIEDGRFFRHKGVDPISFARAMWVNFKMRRIVQGGSTLTQQLAKNLFFSFNRSWKRKLKELYIAFQLESTFSKEKILQAYSNQVYFGSGAYGIEDASQTYFGLAAKDLTLPQAALLAGTIRSPHSSNPFSNYAEAEKRTRVVLNRMVHEEYITREEMEAALKSQINLAKKWNPQNVGAYFVDAVLNKLNARYGPEFANSGGLRIYATLSLKMQKQAGEAARGHLKFLNASLVQKEEPLQAAAVAIDNRSGAVRVMLGGADYSESAFNRALSSNRMTGSSFKPIVYMSAMENLGYHPGTLVVDEPTTFHLPHTKPWRPKNFNERYAGAIVLKRALAKSLNSVSAKLIFKLKPRRVIQTARRFGIKSPLPPIYSLALGAAGASTLDLASAYGVIANLGLYREPFLISRIEDFQGKILYEHFITSQERFKKDSIYPLLDMLQGVMDDGSGRVVRKLGFDHPAGGKTGTTNDFRDAWFTGFTRDLAASVWVGYDSNEPMLLPNGKGVTGSHAAAPIWALFMSEALKDEEKKDFPVPPNIRFEHITVSSGLRKSKPSKNTVRIALKKDTGLSIPPAPLAAVTTGHKLKNIYPVAARPLNSLPKKRMAHAQNPDKPKFASLGKTIVKTPPQKVSNKNLEAQIWFVLNLKNASLGQTEKIPTQWFLQFLRKTKNAKTKNPGRLLRARKTVIEKLLSRIRSMDKPLMQGVNLQDLLLPPEIKAIKHLNSAVVNGH